MLDFIKARVGAFSWSAFFVALGALFTVIGQGGGLAAIVAAVAVVIQALTPAVLPWFTPVPEPVPPAPAKLATPPPAGFRPRPFKPGGYNL